MPDPSTDPASSTAPPGSGGPGAVPSGSTGAGAPTPPGASVTPPQASPLAAQQRIPAAGVNAGAREMASIVLKIMTSKILPQLDPGGEEFKTVSDTISKWSKHFRAAAQEPQMPRMTPGGAPPGAIPGGQMPQMTGGPIGAQMNRGPIPMPA